MVAWKIWLYVYTWSMPTIKLGYNSYDSNIDFLRLNVSYQMFIHFQSITFR